MFVFDWLLIQAKILKNCFKENRRAFLFKDIWHTLILLLGLALLYIFLDTMFGFIDSREMSAFDFSFILLSFSLLIILPLVFYSAVICSLSFLFQKEEVHFYFSLPINRLSVFTVKLLQTYFHTNWMVFLGLLTFLIAVQNHFKTTFLIYFTGIISLFILLLIPVCLAVILVIIISRFFAFVQAKGVMTVIGLLVGSILLAAIRVMQPERLATVEGKMRLATFVQNLHQPWMTILPSEWVTSILFAQIQGDSRGIIVNLLSLLILASILLTLVYLLARVFYERAWVDSVLTPSFTHKKFIWQIILKVFAPSVRGFVRKDLLSFYRDTIEKGSLLILVPLTFVYLYSVYVLNRHIQNSSEEQVFSFLYIYLFNLFYTSIVISGLSGRWVFPSVSLEGNNFKLIKISRISLKDFLKAKFFLGFIPILLLGEILIMSSSFILHLQFSFTLLSVLIIVVLCWGITLLCLIFGMNEADFSIKVPLDFALSIKGFLCLTWELIFVIMVIFFVGLPIALFLYRGFSLFLIFSFVVSLVVIFTVLEILHRAYKLSLIGLSKKEF